MYADDLEFPTPTGATQTLVLDVVALPLTLPTVQRSALPVEQSPTIVGCDPVQHRFEFGLASEAQEVEAATQALDAAG